MTEAEWLASTDPIAMMLYLQGVTDPNVRAGESMSDVLRSKGVNNRSLRLFACACCRQVWHLSTDERSRHAVEVAERYADGDKDWMSLVAAHREALSAATKLRGDDKAPFSAYAASAPHFEYQSRWFDAIPVATQAALLRCIVGNPWRPVRWTHEEVDSEEGGYIVRCWNEDAARIREWNSRAVPRIAAAIYEERAWGQLAVLADALEEAGCTDADLLAHCRGPGPHCRGCWVADLMLGKE